MLGRYLPSRCHKSDNLLAYRGDFGVSKQMNLCHVSDSVASANAEIDLWFASSEIMQEGHHMDFETFG